MDQRSKDQVAKNEVLFRDVNERVKEVDRSHGISTADFWDFLCECGNVECFERIALTIEEYEEVRGDPTTFALVPGHEVPDVEVVVKATDRYAVVKKLPGEDAFGLTNDPRA